MNEKALAIRALAHIQKGGVDDIFRPPLFHGSIEAGLLKQHDYRASVLSDVVKFLKAQKTAGVSSPIKLNIPKNKFAFRAASWIDLVDTAKYLALVMKMSSKIEASRIPIAEDCVFSYRSREHGYLFRRGLGFDEFKRKSAFHSENRDFSVKIITDISNFYDRINIHRVEAILASIGCENRDVSKINELLLLWAGRNSYGLPVGCDGSRLLAEASLINVDDELRARGVTFVRFVDDFRIFAKNHLEANSFLNILIGALDREGLFLNVAKTRMMDIDSNSEDDGADSEGREEFEPVDLDEKVAVINRVRVGYASRMVKTYRYPGKDQIKKYQKIDLKSVKIKIETELNVSDAEIRDFIKGFIYQERRTVSDICDVMSRHVHYMPYIVDALIKEKIRFSKEEKSKIIEYFQNLLSMEKCAEYYLLAAFRICSEPDFDALGVCQKFIREVPLALSPVVLREIVLRMSELGDRKALLQLKSLYPNVGIIVKRAIFFCWKDSLSILPAEKRAFFKTLNRSETDPLIVREAGKAISGNL